MSISRKTAILDATEALLLDLGGAGLTMRKVSERAGISLGNLQYHYATRDHLLEALLHRFLGQYEDGLQNTEFDLCGYLAEDLHRLFLSILSNPEFAGCAAVFKEVWAAANQNPELQTVLVAYYRRLGRFYGEVLGTVAGPEAAPDRIELAVSILLPLLEGYCVTKAALGRPVSRVAEDWAAVVATVLQKPSGA